MRCHKNRAGSDWLNPTGRILLVGFLLSAAITLPGQKLTTLFKVEDQIPPGKAVVYFFMEKERPPTCFRVYINNQPVKPALCSAGYFFYYAGKGTIEISALKNNKQDALIINIDEGNEYYIEGTVKATMISTAPKLQLISSKTAKKKIAECRLITGD